MIPTIYNRPLKIVHGFPRSACMSEDELRRAVTDKLTELRDKGFGGVVSNVSFENYLRSETEWARFRYLTDECERLGLRLWIYDENGYPSGAAGGLTLEANPDFECTGVVLVTKELEPGAEARLELPHGHLHFLRITAYRTSGGLGGITDFTPVQTIRCHGSREVQTLRNDTDSPLLFCAFVQKRLYEGTHAEHNVFDCRRYIDVTYAPAIREFLSNTYEKYYACASDRFRTAELGEEHPKTGGFEAIFTDEPSLMGCYINAGLYPGHIRDPYDDTIPLYPVINWGHDFENAFRSLCGCDVLDKLIYKFVSGGEEGKRFRLDYHRVLSRLFEESFYTQISDWCAEHRLNFSGHILLEDDIRHHVMFEGNYFSLLRHMHYPGIDMLQSIPEEIYENYAFPEKLISSIARAYGRKHVMCEVSAHAQGGNVTVAQQYASVCLQYALGVDIFTYYYSENVMDAPTYRKYNDAHGRIDALLSGKTVSDVMLYYPIETFQMHHLGSDRQYGSYTNEEKQCADTLHWLVTALLRSQIGFDLTDYELLSRCRIENRRLVTPRGDSYAALLLPAMESTPELRGLLADFEAQGLPIRSFKGSAFEDCRYGCCFPDPSELIDSLDRSGYAVSASDGSGRIAMLARETERGRAFLFVNADPEEAVLDLTVGGMKSPVLLDPLENKRKEAKITPVSGGGFRISASLGAYESVVVTEE